MLARIAIVVGCLVAAPLLCGCSGAAGKGPEQALSHFLDLMDRSRVDSRVLPDAFALLDAQTQAQLRERAQRARTLAGRDFEPWQMIAQGRFRLRFAPAPGGMQAEVEGDRATVTVRGKKAGQQVQVPMVHEDGGWRVVLHLPGSSRPAPPPAPGREGGT